MAKDRTKEHALVEVLQPSATSAFDQANQAVEAIPSKRLPTCVRDAAQQSLVVDLLRQVATADKVVDSSLRSVTTHLDAAKRALNKLFSPLKKHLRDLRTDCEGKLNEYRDWQEEQAEVEREKLRKKAEAQRRRIETAAAKKLSAAGSPQEARRIKQEAAAKKQVAEAVLQSRLEDVDDTPLAEEGVAVIQDYEVEIVDERLVPEYMALPNSKGVYPGQIVDDFYLWKRDFQITNLKKFARAGAKVPGVKFTPITRRAVRSL